MGEPVLTTMQVNVPHAYCPDCDAFMDEPDGTGAFSCHKCGAKWKLGAFRVIEGKVQETCSNGGTE